MKILLRSASLLLSGVAVAACSTEPPQALKPAEMPPAFTAPMTKSATAWPSADWWTGFQSTELTELEVNAQQNNLDLAAAAARVLQARGNTGLAASALFPAVDLSGNASRSGSRTTSTTSVAGNSFGVSLNASYELDFWGLAQDNLRAAQNNARSALYAQRVVALTVTSDVANTYLDVLALRDRIMILKKNVEAAKRILTITEAKVANGVSSNLDLAQQRAIVAGAESSIPALEEQEREARYALAVLEGRVPEGFDVKAQSLDGVSAPPVQPDMPAALLVRRPDIAAADMRSAGAAGLGERHLGAAARGVGGKIDRGEQRRGGEPRIAAGLQHTGRGGREIEIVLLCVDLELGELRALKARPPIRRRPGLRALGHRRGEGRGHLGLLERDGRIGRAGRDRHAGHEQRHGTQQDFHGQ